MKKIVLSVLSAIALTATMSVSAANACGYRSAEPCYVEPRVIYVKPKPKRVHCCVKRRPKPKPRCCGRRAVKKVIIKKVYVAPRPRPRMERCVVRINVARPSYCF